MDTTRVGSEGRFARSRLDCGLFVVGSLVVLATALWCVHHFAVNVFHDDQVVDVRLVHRALHGTLTWSDLWAQHNENRILVPNLVVVVLGWTTHLNIVVESWINLALAIVGVVAIIWSHQRWSAETPWVAYLPVVVVLLSFSGISEVFFGFNLSWCLVLASFGVMLLFLDRPSPRQWSTAAAMAMAAVGMMSSFQGIYLWLAGGAVLWLRRRSVRMHVAWWSAMVVMGALFLVGYRPSEAGDQFSTSIQAPLRTVGFFFSELGNVVGWLSHRSTTFDLQRAAMGIAIFVLMVVALVVASRRCRGTAMPVGVAMVILGLAVAASGSIARLTLGLPAAGRYSPFVLELWAGTYLILLSWAVDRRRVADEHGGREPTVGRRLPLLLATVAGLLCLWPTSVSSIELADFRATDTFSNLWVNVEANWRQAPPGTVAAQVAPFIHDVPLVESAVREAEQDHLSFFATAEAGRQRALGLNPRAVAAIVLPSPGTLVTRTTVADAAVTSPARSVTFIVRDADGRTASHFPGKPTLYGWLGVLDPSRLSTGTFTLSATATLVGGSVWTSPPIEFRVP